MSLRTRITLVCSIAIGVTLAVVVGWWVSIQPAMVTPETRWSLWMLIAAVGIVIVSGSGGLIMATLLMAPVRSAERDLRSARSLADVSERIRGLADADLQAVLVAGTAVARSADARARSKALFFAALVHDLKARVAGLALLTERWPEEGSAEHRLVSQELSALSLWLRRILDALRLDQLDAIGERQVTDLRALVESCVQEVAADAERPTRFDVDGSAIVSVDRDELARALGNLLANAARAARSTVSVQVFPGLIRISDDGEGLPRPFEVLIEPYSRATNPGGRGTTRGAGLGMFIAKRVLELHGGKLVCERTGPTGTVLLAYLGGSRER